MKIYYWHDKLFFIWYLFLNPAQEFIFASQIKKTYLWYFCFLSGDVIVEEPSKWDENSST